jgi:chorismate dehydratase
VVSSATLALAGPGRKARPGTPALRLGAVSYLNAEPTVHGLEGEPGVAVERDLPSRVAERLHAGEADLALVPSIEYAFGRYAIVPGVAIASHGKVRSVRLFHKTALARIARVALDTSSRASVGLARVLLHSRLGRDPEYVPMPPGLDAMLAVADAALLIGDPALDAASDAPSLDLGEEWARLTGLPFVYAFWAGPPGVLGAAGVARLQRALAEGQAAFPEIARRMAQGDPARAGRYEAYLRENIVYRLGEQERAGLLEFFRRARALGLVPAVPELRFHGQA